MDKAICDMLYEVAAALYFVSENGDPNTFHIGRYEKLYADIMNLRSKLGCRKK